MLVTNGIRIATSGWFNEKRTYPADSSYVFTYQVVLCNCNPFPVQLLTRHWEIFDGNGIKSYILGKGLFGKFNILTTDEVMIYENYCILDSAKGSMKGYLEFMNVSNGELFQCPVPAMILEVPFTLN